MNKAYLLKPCSICGHVPSIKEHHDQDGLRAVYIDCPGCYRHGPFIHVWKGKDKAEEECANEWNKRNNKINIFVGQ